MGPKNNGQCPNKRQKAGKMQTLRAGHIKMEQRLEFEAPSQGTPRISGNYQKLEKRHENLLPQSLQGTHLCHKLVLIFVK